MTSHYIYLLCTSGLLEIFQNNNALLEQVQKCLEAYLESKRVLFPRCVKKPCQMCAPYTLTQIHFFGLELCAFVRVRASGSTSCPTMSCWRSWHRHATLRPCSRTSGSASTPSPGWSLPCGHQMFQTRLRSRTATTSWP